MDQHKVREIKQYLITNGIKNHKINIQQAITSKKRSQSVSTFFGLTASIIDNIKFSKCPPLKIRQKAKKHSSASISQQKLSCYHSNLIKTTFYNTRQMFLPIQKHRILIQNNDNLSKIQLDEVKIKHRTKKIAAFINHNSDYNSFKTVDNSSLNSRNRLNNQITFQITANQLPIIIKRQRRRKQIGGDSPPKKQSVSPISPKQSPQQSAVQVVPKIENRNTFEYKGVICGWEVPELNQY